MTIKEGQVKFRSTIRKIAFPKNGVLEDGDWGIVVFDNALDLCVVEGEVKMNDYGQLSVTGTYPQLDLGAVYNVTAKESNYNGKFAYELVFINMDYSFDTDDDKRRFLKYVLTESQLNMLYDAFEDPFEHIALKDTDILLQVNGLGRKTIEKIYDAFEKSLDYSMAYIQLDEVGLTKKAIDKLVVAYGSPELLVAKLRENPYIIADEVDGIGWKKADSIAMRMGIGEKEVYRVKAYICYYLDSQANNGHSYVDPNVFAQEVSLELNLTDEEKKTILVPAMYELRESGILYWTEDKSKIGLSSMYELEKTIAEKIVNLLKETPTYKTEFEDLDFTIKSIEEEQGFEFTDEQIGGIHNILKSNVVSLVGLAGSGKSSLLRAVASVLASNGISFCQTALAGKASARIQEVTGYSASTIHRLLGYGLGVGGGFLYNQYNPLPFDVVIVDEVSMIGGELFYQLIRAIKEGKKLILVGDDGQLESIGKLNIFYDILHSEHIPKVKLTKIHRQAQKSAMISDGFKIRNGEQLFSRGWTGKEVRGELQDLVIDIYDEKETVPFAILNVFKEELERLGDVSKIQVIVPMRNRGDISTYALNIQLQEIYNPYSSYKPHVQINKNSNSANNLPYDIRVGDKVLNRKNNYKTTNPNGEKVPIFNGNFGTVKDIYSGMLLIDFEMQGLVEVPKSHWSSVHLGYCATVHSMQGSQTEVIIFGIDYSAYSMLVREMPYTAITRATKLCYIVAQGSALSMAISNSQVPTKRTFLQSLIAELIMQEKEELEE